MGDLFPQAVWVDECRPGYTLAAHLAEVLTAEVDTVLLQNHGVFFAANDAERLDTMLREMLAVLQRDTDNARLLWTDAEKVAKYAASFGGQRPMAAEMVDFIKNWEAESYRKSKA